MKILKIVLIVLLLIGLIIGVYLLNRKAEQPFKQVELPDTANFINNRTDNKYIDTVMLLAANKLGIDGAIISVFPMSDVSRINFERDNGISLKAFIIGSGYQYAVYTEDLTRLEAITVFSHEMIHLKQYNSNRLIVLENGIVKWDGVMMEVNSIPYNDRPWEKEAFENETKLANDLKKILY